MRPTNAKTKRQMNADARKLALEGRWTDAIALNNEILERAVKDAEAHNRVGRAYLGLRQYPDAVEAYSNALRADPANLIARRNLQRLEGLRHQVVETADHASDELMKMPLTAVFIEEIGKTWVDELVNPASRDDFADVLPAEQLRIEVQGDRVVVLRLDGRRLGEIESRTAERVIGLIAGGNRYEAYALGVSAQSLRIILRETYRDPSQAGRISFPRQITSRAYLRERDLLRQRDENDFFMLDDDDDEDEESVRADGDEEETPDQEAEPFNEDTVTVVEDEERTL